MDDFAMNTRGVKVWGARSTRQCGDDLCVCACVWLIIIHKSRVKVDGILLDMQLFVVFPH